jgi:hypothetical protein
VEKESSKDSDKPESSKDSGPPKPTKIKQTYKIRDVIKEVYRKRIEKEIPYKPGDTKYLRSYQTAVTTIYEKLTDDELQAAENTLESWNKLGVPPHMQLK